MAIPQPGGAPVIIRRYDPGFDGESGLTIWLVLRSMRPAQGKYLVGRPAADPRSLLFVFDESAAFHRDIVIRYQMLPDGGGWLVFQPKERRLHLFGRSQEFGREPDRDLVRGLWRGRFRISPALLPERS